MKSKLLQNSPEAVDPTRPRWRQRALQRSWHGSENCWRRVVCHQAPWPSGRRETVVVIWPPWSHAAWMCSQEQCWRGTKIQKQTGRGELRRSLKVTDAKPPSPPCRPSDMQPGRWRVPVKRDISLAKNKPVNWLVPCPMWPVYAAWRIYT